MQKRFIQVIAALLIPSLVTVSCPASGFVTRFTHASAPMDFQTQALAPPSLVSIHSRPPVDMANGKWFGRIYGRIYWRYRDKKGFTTMGIQTRVAPYYQVIPFQGMLMVAIVGAFALEGFRWALLAGIGMTVFIGIINMSPLMHGEVYIGQNDLPIRASWPNRIDLWHSSLTDSLIVFGFALIPTSLARVVDIVMQAHWPSASYTVASFVLGVLGVRFAIKQHGWRNWMANQEDTVVDTVPFTRQKPKPVILIVDDYAPILKEIPLLLRDGGIPESYEIRVATDGHDALREIERLEATDQTIVLMITDVNMKVMDGLALTQEVWVLHPNLPVIFETNAPDIFAKEWLAEHHAEAIHKYDMQAGLAALVLTLLPTPAPVIHRVAPNMRHTIGRRAA